MEATPSPKQSSARFPWKWTFGGAVFGVVFVAAVIVLQESFGKGDSPAVHFLHSVSDLMIRPAQNIFQFFGWQWDWISLGAWQHIPVLPVVVVVLSNAFIFAVVGAGIGIARRILKRVM